MRSLQWINNSWSCNRRTSPYTYSVDGSAFTSTNSYTNLAAGTYAVEVMDVNSCIFSTSASITNTSGPTAIATTIVDAACGASNGSITLGAVTGGIAPYTYSVDGSAFTATTSYPSLAAGTYAVEVRDANGCTFSTTASISNTGGPTAIATTIVNTTCGASNGSITLGAVTGGIAPYTYSVNGSAFTSTTSYKSCCRNICSRGQRCKRLYILYFMLLLQMPADQQLS